MSMNIKTVLPSSGETLDDLRLSGNPFSWEELLSLFSLGVQGKAFDMKELEKSMEGEIKHGSLKVEQGKDGLVFKFEPKHQLNKYPELRKGISLRDKIVSGEIKAKGHEN